MSEDKQYESYEDWYDNGPGSEKFKREMGKPISGSLFMLKPTMGKKVKHSKTALTEQIEALDKKLKANVKLSPHILVNKGLLEEIVKNSRRLLRYVEELDS